MYVDTDSILGPLMNNLAVAPDVQGQVLMMRQTLLSRPNLEAVAGKTKLIGPDMARADADRVLDRLQKESTSGQSTAPCWRSATLPAIRRPRTRSCARCWICSSRRTRA